MNLIEFTEEELKKELNRRRSEEVKRLLCNTINDEVETELTKRMVDRLQRRR